MAPAREADTGDQSDPDLDADSPGLDDAETAQDMPAEAVTEVSVIGLDDAAGAVDQLVDMFRVDHLKKHDHFAARGEL